MFSIIRKKLGLKIALLISAIAIPVMAVGVAGVVVNEHEAVKMLVLQKGEISARVGAQVIKERLQAGVRSGVFTMEELFNAKLVEIPFEFTVKNKRAHLVIPPRCSPDGKCAPGLHVDEWSDSDGWQGIQDAYLADKDFIYASAMHRDGLVLTPHYLYSEIPNGDAKHDDFSRWKQVYTSPLHVAAARFQGPGPTIVQDYLRGNEPVWDIGAPIYVTDFSCVARAKQRGSSLDNCEKHWGVYRVGVLQQQIAVRGRELAIKLGLFLGIATLVIIIVIFWLLQRKLRPLVALTGLTYRLSVDEVRYEGSAAFRELEQPIKAQSDDEIGQMALSLNRLRNSLRLAIDVADKKSSIVSGSIPPGSGSYPPK